MAEGLLSRIGSKVFDTLLPPPTPYEQTPIGDAKFDVHFLRLDESNRSIRWNDAKIQLFEPSLRDNVEASCQKMVALSEKYDGIPVVGVLTNNVVVTSDILTAQDTEDLYYLGAKSIEEAFANYTRTVQSKLPTEKTVLTKAQTDEITGALENLFGESSVIFIAPNESKIEVEDTRPQKTAFDLMDDLIAELSVSVGKHIETGEVKGFGGYEIIITLPNGDMSQTIADANEVFAQMHERTGIRASFVGLVKDPYGVMLYSVDDKKIGAYVDSLRELNAEKAQALSAPDGSAKPGPSQILSEQLAREHEKD